MPHVNETPVVTRGRPDGPKQVELNKPTFDYLVQLREDGKRLFQKDDEQIRTMRKVRELLDPVKIEEDWRVVAVEVRAPIATDNIQRTVSILGVNPADLQCKPSSETDSAQENATKRERATEGILQQAGSRDSGPPTYLMAIDSTVADGGGWTKLVCRWDVWDEVYGLDINAKDADGKPLFEDDPEPEPKKGEEPSSYRRRLMARKTKDQKWKEARAEKKREKGVPFRWVSVDVETLYPFFKDGRIREVIEVTRRPYSSTFREYRLKRAKDGRILRAGARDNTPDGYSAPSPEEMGEGMGDSEAERVEAGATVEFIEHWDAKWVTYSVVGKTHDGQWTGQVVDQWEHGYGRVPYFFAPGIWMNHWKNRKVGWGVSESMRWLVQYLSFLLTVHANLAARDAFTPLQEVSPEQAMPLTGLDQNPRKSTPDVEKWKLGRIYKLAPGRKYEPIQFPDVAGSLVEQIKMVMDLIDQLLTPRVSSQIGGNMEGAGFAISQILAEGRIRHDPISQAIERMLTEVTEFLWHLIKTKVKEPVEVYTDTGSTGAWETLGPDDLKDAVKVIWTVNAETPSAELLKARYWSERLTNGTASWDQAVEGMGDNPDEVRLGRTIDRIREHPAYKAWQEAMVFAHAERGDILVKMAGSSAQQMVDTGVVPPPGDPSAANPANVPDVGALATTPGGGGATPIPPPMGTAAGVGPGATMPGQAAHAQVQNLGPPGQ